jgi:PAS domain S-box-containing protein
MSLKSSASSRSSERPCQQGFLASSKDLDLAYSDETVQTHKDVLYDDKVAGATGASNRLVASIGSSPPSVGRTGGGFKAELRRLSSPTGFVCAAVAMLPVVVAFVLQWILWPAISPLAWFILYPAVLFSSCIGGFRAGFLATAISTLLAWYYFLPPEHSWKVEDPGYVFSSAVFVATGIAVSLFHEQLRKANLRKTDELASLTTANEHLASGIRERTAELAESHESLQASERRFRELVEALPAAIYMTDANGRITFFNHAAVKLWGRSPHCGEERWCGSWRLYLPNGTPLPHSESPMAIALQQDRQVSGMEAIAERPDGTRVPFMAFPRPLRDNSGALVGAVNMLVDITERKQAELSLRESEERFRQVVENIEEVFWMSDLEKNKILFISSGYEKIWRETRESLYSSPRRWVEAIHPADRERVLRDALLKQTSGDYDEEYRIIRSDGTMRWIHDRAFPVRNADGTMDRIAGIAEDITERKQAEEALRLRSRQQGALADLGRRALEGRDLGQLLDCAATLVPQILGIEFCSVLELLPGGEAMLLRAGSGWREGLVSREMVSAGSESQEGFTLLSMAPVIVEDLRTERRFRPSALMHNHGVVSGMNVAIHARGKPFGVLSAHTVERRRFTEVDIDFLQSVGNVLAAAIERRQLEEEVLYSIEREQQRIGQDIHDGLCHQLAGIGFSIGLIARDLPDNLEAKNKLTNTLDHIRDAILEARMLARGLSPVQLESEGFMSALRELASTTEELFKISCSFDCEQPVRIEDNAVATHLYRIAQEGIHNAIKHGHATHVTVTLANSDAYTLTISDDGLGLPAEFSSKGMGLRIMKYRAGMIGGRLSIGAGQENGTKVVCRW